MTSITAVVTAHNSIALADAINVAMVKGGAVAVNGYTPVTAWGKPAAHAWNNGTVSFKVKAKKPGKFNDIYVKVGSALTITA